MKMYRTIPINRADLEWILKFVDNYDYVLEAYPELFTASDIDDIKVVREVIEEKLKWLT